jgi:exopolysaccharide biosynthesis WecB/TagA/CpsF family protein
MHKTAHLVCELDDLDLEGFVAVAQNFGQRRYGYVVTPNIDHFIRLHDDAQFRDLYASAEYVLLDSRFLNTLRRASGSPRLPVCTGSDLTAQLLTAMSDSLERIVIVGSDARRVAQLKDRFALQNIAHHNPPMGFISDSAAVATCVQFIEAHSPFRFCLLALGSPQQEMLARRLLERGVARGLALCVGASIDFITGVEKRAPQWLQRCGFEWMFRLSQQPARLGKRYLVRGPRIFWLLRKTKFVLRTRNAATVAT